MWHLTSFETYLREAIRKSAASSGGIEPTLEQRAAAIEHLPKGHLQDSTPAISLLDNIPELEAQALAAESETGREEWKPLLWTQIGQFVVIPGWEELCSQYRFDHVTLDKLPKVAPKWLKNVLTAALGLCLFRQGWYIDYGPGYVRMGWGKETVDLQEVVRELASGELTAEKWRQMLKHWRLDPSLPLVEPDSSSVARRSYFTQAL